MSRARPKRARQSRYSVSYRLTRSVPAAIIAALLLVVVHMHLQTNSGSIWTNKINAAYEVPYTSIICCVATQYSGPNGGGYAAEHEVGKVTGLTFDRYIAVDFKAFRDMVNALGGVDVCLGTSLNDYEYPNYTNGYKPIHFKAGCQHLNGQQAQAIARW